MSKNIEQKNPRRKNHSVGEAEQNKQANEPRKERQMEDRVELATKESK